MILAIESSCDDSSIAVMGIGDKKLYFHKKISQESEHANFGGVVPELASRLHATALPKLLEQTKPYFGELKAIAVTNEPGLAVTLLEGITMAKTLSISLHLPLLAIHHLKGHIYSLFIEKQTAFPKLIVLLSGGHTMIVRAQSYEKMQILATTLDDSVGESFDKVAKMMGLGYPGGPIIESLALQGDAERFNYPIPLRNSPLLAFSLSGLKNAVRLSIEALGGKEKLSEQDKCDIAASFQRALTVHLLQKCKKIFAKEPIDEVAIVGGVAANRYIKSAFESFCASLGKRLSSTPLPYCSDNAAMIARAGIDAYQMGLFVSPREVAMRSTKKLKAGSLL